MDIILLYSRTHQFEEMLKYLVVKVMRAASKCIWMAWNSHLLINWSSKNHGVWREKLIFVWFNSASRNFGSWKGVTNFLKWCCLSWEVRSTTSPSSCCESKCKLDVKPLHKGKGSVKLLFILLVFLASLLPSSLPTSFTICSQQV